MLWLVYFGWIWIGFCGAQNFPGSSLLGGPSWKNDQFIRPKIFTAEEKGKQEDEKIVEVKVPLGEEIHEGEKAVSDEELDQFPVEVPVEPRVPNIIPDLSIKNTDFVNDEPQPNEADQNDLPDRLDQDLPELPLPGPFQEPIGSINGLTLPPLIPISTNITNNNNTIGPFAGPLRCQDPTTLAFIPTAQACQDVRGAELCQQIFSLADPKTGKRDPKCDQKGFEDISTTCRHTCGLCCEDLAYSCEDDSNNIIDCSKQVDKCNSPKWFNVLSRYCAGTCGLCNRTSCRDNQVDCRILKGVCNISEHEDQMKKNCARTCGFCSVEDAIPLEPGAPAPSPGTGGGNNGGTGLPGPTCIDHNSRCATWVVRGFCENRFYTTQYKRENCARSCNLC